MFFTQKTIVYFLLAAIPLFIIVVMAQLRLLNCIHCGTPMWDVRTIGKTVPVSPAIVDECGVCGRPLFREKR